jgi:hypothetical protein
METRHSLTENIAKQQWLDFVITYKYVNYLDVRVITYIYKGCVMDTVNLTTIHTFNSSFQNKVFLGIRIYKS